MLTGRNDLPPDGHALSAYTKGLGTNEFSFSLTDPKTATQIAANVETFYAAGKNFSLSIEDGLFSPENEINPKLTHYNRINIFHSPRTSLWGLISGKTPRALHPPLGNPGQPRER
jgi:hypothetical protein